MEFKENKKKEIYSLVYRINRIRLEFKVEVNISICRSAVCINRIRLEFKATQAYQRAFLFFVLIESDWNLKIDKTKMAFTTASVLIESDWNLKLQDKAEPCGQDGRINRIRLEFKVVRKDTQGRGGLVLIESDWNLKDIQVQESNGRGAGINRIRLEFKVGRGTYSQC